MESEPDKEEIKPVPLLFSARLTLFIVFMFATFSFLLQRMNISFALVCMVKRPNLTSTETFSFENSSESIQRWNSSLILFEDEIYCKNLAESRRLNTSSLSEESPVLNEGEFEWSKDVQGAILGSFYYGYLFTQVFGGWLAERFGAKLAFLLSTGSLGLLTLLNPIAARFGPEFLFFTRLLQGLTHGAALPAMNTFAARWCAPEERGFLMGIAYGGFGFAAAFTFPICAFLCKNFNWEAIFYFTGGFGVLVCLISCFLIYEWPEGHPRISQLELQYLQKTSSVSKTSRSKKSKPEIPWRHILTSVPVNIVHITQLCFTWGFLMIGMYMPTFLKEVLFLDTGTNGIYSSLPYMGQLIVHFIVGSVFDYFRRRNCCSVTNLRKIFNSIGMFGPALALSICGFLSCQNIKLGIGLVTFGQSLAEFAFMGGFLLGFYPGFYVLCW